MGEGGNTVPRITKSEHIGPDDTGDNIHAKKVASYGFGTDSAWARVPLPMVDAAYDSIALSNADINGNYQTIDFKNGSTTVRTLTLAFDGDSKVTSVVRT